MAKSNWQKLSKEQQSSIEKARACASYKTPFKGKNRTQRYRLSLAFESMRSLFYRRTSGLFGF